MATGVRTGADNGYLADPVQVLAETRQQQTAARSRRLGIVLGKQRHGAQYHQGGGEYGHGTGGHDFFSTRRRLTITADNATAVSSSGTSPMLMNCRTVPNRSMLRSRLRCTPRNSWRMRTCSSRNLWISALLFVAHQQGALVRPGILQLAEPTLGLGQFRLQALLGLAKLRVGLVGAAPVPV